MWLYAVTLCWIFQTGAVRPVSVVSLQASWCLHWFPASWNLPWNAAKAPLMTLLGYKVSEVTAQDAPFSCSSVLKKSKAREQFPNTKSKLGPLRADVRRLQKQRRATRGRTQCERCSGGDASPAMLRFWKEKQTAAVSSSTETINAAQQKKIVPHRSEHWCSPASFAAGPL